MASRVASLAPHLRLVRTDEGRHERARARIQAANRSVAMLVLPAAGLTVTGLAMVLSASSVSAYARYGSSFVFFNRQAAYAVVGTLGLLLAAHIRYEAWRRLSLPLLGVSLLLLALVLNPAAGTVVGGSARWITLGSVTIQPSELAKLAVVTVAAMVLARKWDRLDDLGHLILPLLPVVLVVCLLVMLQPDLGTTTLIAGTVFLMLFAAGARLRHLATIAIASGGLGFALIMGESYRRARLLSYWNPWADPQNTGYQLVQSLIALGSGGWTGVGLGASRQKWLYVPNAHTDFVFSILGEELGLVGELVVLAMFGLLVYAGIRVAARAPDVFGRMLAAGVASWIGLQTVVNLGAVTGLLPITGVPLPLVSYGGSSLVVTLTGIGILVGIARAPVRAARFTERAAARKRGERR